MIMTRYNSGQLLKLDYESDLNAARRFIICNPGISRNRYKDRRYENTTRKQIKNLIIKKQTRRYWKNPWLQQYNWYLRYFDNKYQKVRQCPLCAIECFHSHVYLAPWFKCCPFHEIPLSENCPDCGSKWPTTFSKMSGKCHTCGHVDYQSLNLQTRICISYQNRHNYLFHRLWLWANLMHNMLWLICQDRRDHKYKLGIDFSSLCFPYIAEQWFPGDLNLINAVSDKYSHFHSITFKIEFNLQQCIFYKTKNTMEQIKEQELRKLQQALRNKGIGINYDKNRYRIIDLIYNMTSTATALMLSVDIFSDVLNNKDHTDIQADLVFSRLQRQTPQYPVYPVALVDNTDNSLFGVPQQLVKWYARTSIRWLFIYIYKCMLRICHANRITNDTFHKLHMTSYEEPFNPQYTAFCCHYVGQEQIQVIYQKLPSWGSIFDNESIMNYCYKEEHLPILLLS